MLVARIKPKMRSKLFVANYLIGCGFEVRWLKGYLMVYRSESMEGQSDG